MLVRLCGTMLVVVCAASLAMAQRDSARQGAQGQAQGQAQRQQGQAQQGDAVRPSGEIDHREIAAWLILGSQAEIELGNFAFEKSQNENVREFAQQMVKDHTAFAAKLKKFVPGTVSARPQTGAREGADASRPRDTAQQEAVAREEHGGSIEFGRKAAALELSMTKQLLGKEEGRNFDMCYIGQQVGAHVKELACLTVAQDIGPEDFQKTIGEGLVMTREHLQQAQQLAQAFKEPQGERRESARPDLRQGERRDGGARPSIRPQDSDVPREGAPESARDREGITP